MPYILSLETSTTVCSVALHKAGTLIGVTELYLEKSHSAFITVAVQELLKYAGLSLHDLKAIALSDGPGSYTGLRIGASTAKGLCFGLDLPLIKVSTLAAMAQQQIETTPQAPDYLYCPMLDARRMEVYMAVYTSSLEIITPVSPHILSADSFSELLVQQKMLFFGNGAAKFKPLVAHTPNAVFLADNMPSAKSVGRLAYELYLQEQFENLDLYEPFYLKEFYTTATLPVTNTHGRAN